MPENENDELPGQLAGVHFVRRARVEGWAGRLTPKADQAI